MKKTCIKAYHEMEERYSRLVLAYSSTEQRNHICNTVGKIIEVFKVAPSVVVTPGKDLSGEYSIEFHDDYDKQSGKFFEEVIKQLDIEHCEV